MIVPDLRGHGASTGAGQFTFEDAVNDIVALLELATSNASVSSGSA